MLLNRKKSGRGATHGTSLIAYYTSYHAYLNGFSSSIFVTNRGRILYVFAWPLLKFIEIFGGLSLKSFLLQRHLIIDDLLDEEILQHCDCAVLEIGAGYSARGYRFISLYGRSKVDYTEVDLAHVIAEKRTLLRRLPSKTLPRLKACDISELDGDQSLEKLLLDIAKSRKHLVVITEGVVDYMSRDQAVFFWSRIASTCRHLTTVTYLTDITPRSERAHAGKFVRLFTSILGRIVRTQLTRPFASDSAAAECLIQAGFDSADIIDPSINMSHLPPEASNGQVIVRIARACLN